MKYLRKFNESVNVDFPTDPDEIRKICEEIRVVPSKIHPDGTVDVVGNVDFDPIPSLPWVPSFMLYHETGNPNDTKTFKNGRLPIKFGIVTEGFNIRGGGLTTLEGSPQSVKYFFCRDNDLTDLKGAPDKVELNFTLANCNELTSLNGLSKYIGASLWVKSCKKLWDVRTLKDTFFEKRYTLSFNHTPVEDFLKLFGKEKFIDSLIFNYIRRTPDGHRAINLFRFKEALEDAEIPIEKVYGESPQWSYYDIPTPKYFGRHWQWIFVNDEGQRVNLNGERI